jgi:hypothetical protein
MVDDERLDGFPAILQFEAELLLHRRRRGGSSIQRAILAVILPDIIAAKRNH